MVVVVVVAAIIVIAIAGIACSIELRTAVCSVFLLNEWVECSVVIIVIVDKYVDVAIGAITIKHSTQ